MPRYYFHTRDGQRDHDDIGVELADAAEARREAVRFGGGLLGDDPDIISNENGLRIDVIDEAGSLCFAIVIAAVDATKVAVKG